MALDTDAPGAALIELLRCPESGQRVALAPPAIIAELEQLRQQGKLRTRAGEVDHEPIVAGLLREDGAVLFPIKHGIPILLIEESFAL